MLDHKEIRTLVKIHRWLVEDIIEAVVTLVLYGASSAMNMFLFSKLILNHRRLPPSIRDNVEHISVCTS